MWPTIASRSPLGGLCRAIRRQPAEVNPIETKTRSSIVRGHLLGGPKWDLEAWGLPIAQPYMALTLAEFCSIALRAMGQLGVRYTDAELEDIHHLWRYVGHLVGVEEALLPRHPADYARIEELYALTSPGPDRGDQAFVAALADFQAVADRRTRRALAWRRTELARMKKKFAVDDLVDGAS